MNFVIIDLSGYNTGDSTPTCHNGLQIPKEDDGYEVPIDGPGRVGATGATGPTGKQVMIVIIKHITGGQIGEKINLDQSSW